MEEEKPSKADTTFLITPATVEGGGAVGGVLGADDAMVIFCIDVSGSMCVTTEVSTCELYMYMFNIQMYMMQLFF